MSTEKSIEIRYYHLKTIGRDDLIPEYYRRNAEMYGKDSSATANVPAEKLSDNELEALKKISLTAYRNREPRAAGFYTAMNAAIKLRALSKSNAAAATTDNFDPASIKVRTLDNIPQAIRLLVNHSKNRWLFKVNDDQPLGYILVGAQYVSATRNNSAHTVIWLGFSDTDGRRFVDTVSFYSDDLRPDSLMRTADDDDDGDIDDDGSAADDDEESESAAKKKKKTPAEGISLVDVLRRRDIFLNTPEFNAQYEEAATIFGEYARRCGVEFRGISGSKARKCSDDDDAGWWRDRDKDVSLCYAADADTEVSYRLVLDDTKEERGSDYWREYGWGWSTREAGELTLDYQKFWSTVDRPAVPVKTVLRFYDLDRHFFVRTHVLNVKRAEYDDSIREKLVMPDADLSFVDMLVGSVDVKMSDIISGKTGGVVILSSGAPGTGKTLTAEVYASHLKKPLYSVQCSQLGLDEKELEKRLTRVLHRANRWKTILLLDEADVYVRARGFDIQHNAIVGVFLRVLEYYRGVMFMTTNKPGDIDDAILSRCTAHIHYKVADGPMLVKLWTVLSQQFNVNLSEADITELISYYGPISGRSIKNAMKLTRYMAKRRKTAPTVNMVKQVIQYLDVTARENATA